MGLILILACFLSKRGSGVEMQESNLERYRVFRGQIEHESTLVGIRLGWLIAAEAFLTAAYATVLTASTNGSHAPKNYISQLRTLHSAIPLAGMVLSGLVGVSIWAALLAMGRVRKTYQKIGNVPAGLPEVTVNRWIYYGGSAAPFFVPLLTFIGWIYLLLTGR